MAASSLFGLATCHFGSRKFDITGIKGKTYDNNNNDNLQTR